MPETGIDEQFIETEKYSEHEMLTIRDSIFIYGGFYDNGNRPFNEILKYDTVRQSWTKYKKPRSVEAACVVSAVCTAGDRIYIYGGIRYPDIDESGQEVNPFEDHRSNSIVSFDTENGTWYMLSPTIRENDENTPPPMFDASMFHFNGSLYIFGGFALGQLQKSMYRFCLTTLKWSRVQQYGEIPEPEFRPVRGTVFQNRRHSTDPDERFKKVTVFNILTCVWSTKETTSATNKYPDDRSGESFAFCEGQAYMTGGMIRAQYMSDVWNINLKTLEWRKMKQLHKARSGHITSIVGNYTLYSFGGIPRDTDAIRGMESYIFCPLSLYRASMQYLIRSGEIENKDLYLPRSFHDEFNAFPPKT
ncbi:Kelch repeat-containing protein 2 [Thelohanellus kitauei]|uniref:Kelch repeat-containing protein 2 n=1 Tax=Thelohanellus kitauei TaxID=669202 RepID=A0A0C2JRG6_THEKT|nr:Kelch repeat-containing protein 2 [Thelohanellus kitauei]